MCWALCLCCYRYSLFRRVTFILSYETLASHKPNTHRVFYGHRPSCESYVLSPVLHLHRPHVLAQKLPFVINDSPHLPKDFCTGSSSFQDGTSRLLVAECSNTGTSKVLSACSGSAVQTQCVCCSDTQVLVCTHACSSRFSVP